MTEELKFNYSFSLKNVAIFVTVALLYYLASNLGLRIIYIEPFVTPIWVPAGITVASVVLLGYRIWPAICLGSFISHLDSRGWELGTFVIPVACTLEGLASAYLVNKFAGGAKAFETAKGVFLFVLFACICTPIIDPAIGLMIDLITGHPHFVNSEFRGLTWWFAYGTGTLLVAPFLILLFGDSHHRMDRREFGELLLLLAGLIFVCFLVFGPLSMTLNKDGMVRVWVCIPFLMWASFRFCPLEAAGTTVILFGSAVWGTLHGTSTFVAKNLTVSLVALDSFIGVIGTMTLVVAALVVERRKIEGEFLGTQALLRDVLSRKDHELVETVQALEVEIARHEETRKVLQESREQVRLDLKDRKAE